MQMDELISVIIPAHNAERYIARSIQSVIMQSYANWELIVIDDASTDHTIMEIDRFCQKDSRVRCITLQTNGGVAAARNAGIACAKGKYIAFLDSDDLWHPEKLRVQAEKIHDADLVYTAYSVIDDRDDLLYNYSVPDQLSLEVLLKENFIGCSTVLVRKNAVSAYPFRSDVAHEDYLLWLQLLQAGHSAIGCCEVLTSWRFIRGSRSYGKLRSAYGRYRIYRILGLPFVKRICCFTGYCIRGFVKYYHVLRGGRNLGG